MSVPFWGEGWERALAWWPPSEGPFAASARALRTNAFLISSSVSVSVSEALGAKAPCSHPSCVRSSGVRGSRCQADVEDELGPQPTSSIQRARGRAWASTVRRGCRSAHGFDTAGASDEVDIDRRLPPPPGYVTLGPTVTRSLSVTLNEMNQTAERSTNFGRLRERSCFSSFKRAMAGLAAPKVRKVLG